MIRWNMKGISRGMENILMKVKGAGRRVGRRSEDAADGVLVVGFFGGWCWRASRRGETVNRNEKN